MHTILGINGITGQALAKALLTKNVKIRGVSRRLFEGDWEHISADVLNFDSLNRAIAGSEVVYCCVGLPYNIKVWRRDWPILIENVIQACLNANAKLVFLDNVYMYGYVEGVMTEETPMNPTSEKGKVRQHVAEKILDAIHKRGLVGCIARAADFYGPDCGNSMLTETVIKNLAKGKAAQMLGNPDKIHAYTYTEDIGQSLAILGTDDRANGQVWHLPTSNTPITGRQIVEMIAQGYGVNAKITPLSSFMVKILGFFIPILAEVHEMMYQYKHDYRFDSSKFERVFGYQPISYAEGLKQTIAFYKQT